MILGGCFCVICMRGGHTYIDILCRAKRIPGKLVEKILLKSARLSNTLAGGPAAGSHPLTNG